MRPYDLQPDPKEVVIEVVIDGAARGQGHDVVVHGALAFVVYANKRKVAQFARGLGKATNNQAEYEALIHALLFCWGGDFRTPVIYSDSLLVTNQVNGIWDCANQNLLPLLASVKEIQEVYPFHLLHVPRHFVAEADKLCNAFLNAMLVEP